MTYQNQIIQMNLNISLFIGLENNTSHRDVGEEVKLQVSSLAGIDMSAIKLTKYGLGVGSEIVRVVTINNVLIKTGNVFQLACLDLESSWRGCCDQVASRSALVTTVKAIAMTIAHARLVQTLVG